MDRDAWICDLAETYGIFDYRALPVELLATLSFGLREDSRIEQKMNGMKTSNDTMLLMLAVDCLRMLVWMNTADGAKNINRPKSLVDELFETTNTNKEFEAFNSGEDFETRRRKIIEGV
ncbi:MAG: DUF5361 domain-containing protein [[Clostridium] symbiosum]